MKTQTMLNNQTKTNTFAHATFYAGADVDIDIEVKTILMLILLVMPMEMPRPRSRRALSPKLILTLMHTGSARNPALTPKCTKGRHAPSLHLPLSRPPPPSVPQSPPLSKMSPAVQTPIKT